MNPLPEATKPTVATESSRDQLDARPGVAILCNVMAPYRANLHQAIANGIPEIKLHSLITHGTGTFDWQVDLPPEIHATNVSIPGEHPEGHPFRHPYGEWRKARRLIRYLKTHAVRAVVLNTYRYVAYLRVMEYCHRARIPFFVHNDSNIRNERIRNPLQRVVKQTIYSWWMKRASGVFSMGELGDQFFLKYGANPQRIYRVPCWPDFDAFSRCDMVALERFQRKFGIDGQRRLLMFSGRIAPEKRVDLLIDAFAAIAHQRPDWDLMIVGDGPLGPELRDRLPAALRSRVVWTGFLDGATNATAYHAAKVLVLPSDREPWALVVQEAMAAGLVVVSSDVVGAAYELVGNGRSGRIFPSRNLEELKKAILDVTVKEALEAFSQESRAALARWRIKNNPASEVRRALMDVGVLRDSLS